MRVMSGVLYVVSTPIGNLEDITLRALRVLREVAVIAAEDTRRTARLLQHYEIHTPTTSFHAHNERRKVGELLRRLAAGDDLALVTDAGTPAIADPGFSLVHAARAAGHAVEPIPGPSALLAALAGVPFPTETFTFWGFPPRKASALNRWIQLLAKEPRTAVFFEAPHRIRQTLGQMIEIMGDRQVCLARELTKKHEEWVIGPISRVCQSSDLDRGELVVVLPPAVDVKGDTDLPTDQDIFEYMGQSTKNSGGSKRAAVQLAAEHFGLSPNAVYSAVERWKRHRETAPS